MDTIVTMNHGSVLPGNIRSGLSSPLLIMASLLIYLLLALAPVGEDGVGSCSEG